MGFIRNKPVSGFTFTLINKTTGSALTSAVGVTGKYCLDGGVQGELSGSFTHEGNGQLSIDTITAAEMNGKVVGLLFLHNDAIPVQFTIKTDLTFDPHTWYVEADDGNDANGGQEWWDAFATIGAAITAASAGDTIIVGPGDYEEVVDMTSLSGITLVGSGWGTRIFKSDQVNVLITGDNTWLKNIMVDNTRDINGSTAIYCAGRTRMTNVYAKSLHRALNTEKGIEDLFAERCLFYGPEYVGVFSSTGFPPQPRMHVIMNDCIFWGSWDGCANCVLTFSEVDAVFSNCVITIVRADNPAAFTQEIVRAFEDSDIVFNNCVLRADITTINSTGMCYGLNNNASRVTINGGIIQTPTDESFTSYDIITQNDGITIVNGCLYDVSKVSGDLVLGNSGGVNAAEIEGTDATDQINAAVDAALDTDIPGSPTAGSINERVNIAAKLLKNKAVQNKSTGAIEYYDDDGETVILTHTPADDESEITRTPS